MPHVHIKATSAMHQGPDQIAPGGFGERVIGDNFGRNWGRRAFPRVVTRCILTGITARSLLDVSRALTQSFKMYF